MTSGHSTVTSATKRKRTWLFRLGAIVFGLTIFVFVEMICVLFGWGRPAEYDDPFVGFRSVHPLFVLDESTHHYVIPKSRLQFFAPESFPADKDERTFRVFCLGGSTVQGRPFSSETSFTSWLGLSLQAADSSREWQIVNCGGISYASYRLVPILEECLAYQPDLFIICTGHNEFLEERTYEHVKHAPEPLAVVQRAVAHLRTFNLLRYAVEQTRGSDRDMEEPKPKLKDEVDALLDYRGGLKAFTRNDAWRAGVIEHYEHNLRRMLAIADDAGVPVILVRPPSNLCDCPPFKSEHRAGIGDERLDRWAVLVREAQANYRTDLRESIRLLKSALAIDDGYAATWYELGKCYETLGLREQARDAFIRARDEDICPLRILSPMEEALQRVAVDFDTPLVDAHRLLEQECPGGILGDYLLIDHIHPSFDGHQMLSNALTEQMDEQGLIDTSSGWAESRDRQYRDHFDSLDDFYFHKGTRTLDSLRAWTQGRADGPPIEQRLNEVRGDSPGEAGDQTETPRESP